MTGATQVTVGNGQACALLAGGDVDCWGYNNDALLGIGTNSGPDTCHAGPCSTTPVAVDGITNATQVAAGGNDTCALLASGGVDCWGVGLIGGLGDGDTAESTVPVAVTGISDATQVTTGLAHMCALLSDGHIKCWGYNGAGELGDRSHTGPDSCGKVGACSTTPVAVAGISNARQVAAGAYHTCALLVTGRIDCWGYNHHGELGSGESTGPDSCGRETQCSTSPVAVHGIANGVEVTAGYDNTCALLATGRVECWGYNGDGELGDGHTSSSSLPQIVKGLP
jgi:alpha-tubulin suppressor-like RCC1 family protein